MNSKVASQVHVQALLDDPLHAARAAAREGERIIGYLGNDIPVALIFAAGALPVRLRGVASGTTTRADQFVESAFPPEMRLITERWLSGDLDFIDAVVFPRTDDSAQRLYYYLCELQRRKLCAGPKPLLYDVANIGRPMSVEYTCDSTRRLALQLGASEAELARAVNRVTRRDELLREIRSRRAADSPLAGSLAWRLERASACDWREALEAAARLCLEHAPALVNPRRILLAGDPPPDDSLHRLIEDHGGSVVMEITESAQCELPEPSPRIDAVSERIHAQRNPALAMREDGQWVTKRARDAGADAVVFWLIEENEALPWEIARQMHSLVAAGIPALLLSRQSWKVTEDSLRRVGEFVRTLEVAR